MGDTPLFDTMTRQVADQCESTLIEARREADAILEEARTKSNDSWQDAMKATETEIKLLEERWVQKAQAEAAKAELAVQNEAVEAVLAALRVKIRGAVEGSDFPNIIEALLSELMAVAPDNVVVLAPEQQVGHVTKLLAKTGHTGVPVEGSAIVWDGVAVQDKQRTFRISNTLTGRYSRVEDGARKLCMVTLFGKGKSNGASEGEG